MEIKVNDYPAVISVSHVTEPGEGCKGTILIAECHSLQDVNKILNDPKRQPDLYWLWCVEFQDKEDLK